MSAIVLEIPPARFGARIPELSRLLHACVQGGASVNFVAPFETADAERFWREGVGPPLARGARRLWIAEQDGALVGTVQLALETPPNQPHRAEVTKLLVDPAQRRRGVGAALMRTLEAEARRLGRWLITLDTTSGDAGQRLYASLGFEVAGAIPAYSRAVHDPDRWDATTLMYKRLDAAAAAPRADKA